MQPDDETQTLTLRYFPVLEWIIAIAMGLVFGGFSYFVMGGRVPLTGDTFHDVISSVVALFAFSIMIYFFTELEMRFAIGVDFRQKYLDVVNHRLYGKRVRRFHFHQIEKIRSYKQRLNFREQYFLAVVLVTRKTVKLKLPLGGDKNRTVNLIKGVNRRIRSDRRSTSPA